MAPLRKLRTYGNSHTNNAKETTKSESVFNDLLAKNLKKRLECSAENTTLNTSQTTFDRLLEGSFYNNVELKTYPRKYYSDDSLNSGKETQNCSEKQEASSLKELCSDYIPESFEYSSKPQSRSLPTHSSDECCHSQNEKRNDQLKETYLNNLHLVPNNHIKPFKRKKNSGVSTRSHASQYSSKGNELYSALQDNIHGLHRSPMYNHSDGLNLELTPYKRKNFSFQCNCSEGICNESEFMTKTPIIQKKLVDDPDLGRITSILSDIGAYDYSKDKSESVCQKHHRIITSTPHNPETKYYESNPNCLKSYKKRNMSNLNRPDASPLQSLQQVNHGGLSNSTPSSEKVDSEYNSSSSWYDENLNSQKKSYQIIDLWNHKRPSFDSFNFVEKSIFSQASRRRFRAAMSSTQKRIVDPKLGREAVVFLNRNVHLENMVAGQSISKERASINSKKNEISVCKRKYSRKFVTERRRNKKTYAEERDVVSKQIKTRMPIILLNPIKLPPASINSNINSTERLQTSSKRKRKRKHVCSKTCECFQLVPRVLLTRLDGFMKPIEKDENYGTVIDISDDSSEDENPKGKSHNFDTNNDLGRQRAMEECYVQLRRESFSKKRLNQGRVAILERSHIFVRNERNYRSSNSTSVHADSDGKESQRKMSNGVIANNTDPSCDIIDDSFEEPFQKKDYIYLPAGKKFRRSIMAIKAFRRSMTSTDKMGKLNEDEEVSSLRHSRVVIVSPQKRMTYFESRSENNSRNDENTQKKVTQEAFLDISDKLSRNCNVDFEKEVCSAMETVFRKCDQKGPLTFDSCYTPSCLKNCKKIGEGVFGEVFMFRGKDGISTVMKVIPIEGDQIINSEKQKTYAEIVSELIISSALSDLRRNDVNNTECFSEVKKIRCVKGCYPERLLELWNLYDEEKTSENDSPEIFLEDQLFIVLELSNGGTDLEGFVFKNAEQSLAVFKQIAIGIAVAEKELQFEHRDLHWGNVLVAETKDIKSNYVLEGKHYSIFNKGVKATIIDFTLSRIECDGAVIFNDLSKDEDLFIAKGDYQFEVYRLMRKYNENNWQEFRPFSNILWLHYILDKATTVCHYKNVRSKTHRTAMDLLNAYKNKILIYDNVVEFVLDNIRT